MSRGTEGTRARDVGLQARTNFERIGRVSPWLARRRRRSRLGTFSVAIGSILLASAARAETAVEKVHLEYSASPTCPSADAFAAALRRDTPAFELVGADEARRLIDVDLRAETGSARGWFRFVDRAHGTTIDRELAGPDCDAVGRALAMMLALAMFRLSSSQETIAQADDDALAAPHKAAPPEHTGDPVPTPPPPPPERSLVSVDVRGAVTRAVIAAPLPFGALTVHLEPRGWRLRPSLALSARQSLPQGIGIAGGDATFRWTAGALRVCPHIFSAGPFELAPCIEGALGLLRANAAGLPSSRNSTRDWREISGVAEARWHLSKRWFVLASAALSMPLSRSRFELSSGALISQAPDLGLGAGLGLGLSL